MKKEKRENAYFSDHGLSNSGKHDFKTVYRLEHGEFRVIQLKRPQTLIK